MTSPSCPVSVSPVAPVSGSASEASTNSTSPPAPVTASPVATPGTVVRSADSGVNRGRPPYFRSCSRSMRSGAADGSTASVAATFRRDPGEQPLEVAHPGLAGVLPGELLQHLVGQRHVGIGQPGLLHLAGE